MIFNSLGIKKSNTQGKENNMKPVISKISSLLLGTTIATTAILAADVELSKVMKDRWNVFEEKPMADYKIDYQYYIVEARKIINEIETNQIFIYKV